MGQIQKINNGAYAVRCDNILEKERVFHILNDAAKVGRIHYDEYPAEEVLMRSINEDGSGYLLVVEPYYYRLWSIDNDGFDEAGLRTLCYINKWGDINILLACDLITIEPRRYLKGPDIMS